MSQRDPSRNRLRAKQRQVIAEHAIEHGKKPACRRFGLPVLNTTL